jgi:putative nucleotidyltransferase with HDIG domain
VLEIILKSRNIKYALFDPQLALTEASPDLVALFSSPIQGKHITDIFGELIGCEPILSAIQANEHEPLIIENIRGSHLAQDNGYFYMQVQPYEENLLVIIQDVTSTGSIEQKVTQRRNELDILAAELIDDLKQTNTELQNSYETTLEGWAKALELRDYESKNHSQRVTKSAMRLAVALGIEDEQLVHIRRGALLHDIGKMGIPDSILVKKGPLTDKEMDIMRMHTQYAYDLLYPIPYLRPAISIPYSHHEKWDGSGYPNGFKGKDIPFAARLFAIVDVWDALISDRPYRNKWSHEKSKQYLLSKKGTHFEPDLLDVFLGLIG